jgi:hypothetical protein
VVTIYTTCFNIVKLYILPTQCIYVFHVVLTINRDCFPKRSIAAEVTTFNTRLRHKQQDYNNIGGYDIYGYIQ